MKVRNGIERKSQNIYQVNVKGLSSIQEYNQDIVF